MIDYINEPLFREDSADKQLRVIFNEGTGTEFTITNNDLYEQEFSINEILCDSKQLEFGMCNASQLKFSVGNIDYDLIGKWCTVKMIINGDTVHPLTLGKYKVKSDKPDADRTYRKIEAYDVLYDVINSDVTEWYNNLFSSNSSYTLLQFRTSFFNHFGITQEAITLPNDTLTVTKTMDPKTLSGKDVINAICQVNGAFGHINRNNQFRYVILQPISNTDLFPSDTLFPDDDLYPIKSSNIYPTNTRISCTFEEYLVETIDGIQIRNSEDDIGAVYGICDNPLIIQNNFLCYGKTSAELQTICQNLYPIIDGIWYRPYEATFLGNPCVELGDGIMTVGFNSNTVVRGYVLERTLKGVQALTDDFTCQGTQYRDEEVNGVQSDIIQLNGKINELTRTNEETRSYISDSNGNLIKSSEIVQKADNIQAEVTSIDKNGGLIDTKIAALSMSGGAITLAVSAEKTRAEGIENSLSSAIKLKPDNISLTLDNQGTTTGITIGWKENGVDKSVSGNIVISGTVTFTDLSTAGRTTISGNNISTGTISLDRLSIKDNVRIESSAINLGWFRDYGSDTYFDGISIQSDGIYLGDTYQQSNFRALGVERTTYTDDTLAVGQYSRYLNLYGDGTRPTYNGSDLALLSDVSGGGADYYITSKNTSGIKYGTETVYYYGVNGSSQNNYLATTGWVMAFLKSKGLIT